MRISTKGRYGLKLMVDLAVSCRNEMPVPLKSIARRAGLSEKYLEQIIKSLVREGLVLSSRGAQGGYRLSRPPAEITAGDILRAAEGDLSPVACVDKGWKCDEAEFCATYGVWNRIKLAVDQVVDGITLAELAEEYIRKKRAGPVSCEAAPETPAAEKPADSR